MNNLISQSSEAFFVIAFCSIDPSQVVSLIGGLFLLLSCVKVILDIKYHPKNKRNNGKDPAGPGESGNTPVA